MGLYEEQIEAGESLTTEFKREYTEEIKKTIIAFANTAGGTLFIGINDDKSVTGVDNPDNTMLQLSNSIRLGIKPDVTLFVDYKIEKIKKAAIVIATVQKGTACPYYLANKGIRPEGVYVRQGASSVPATETAILNMIKETDGEKYEEMRSLNQKLSFNEIKRFFEKESIPFGTNQQKTMHLQTTDGTYTNLGLLLSDQSVHTVKLAVFDGIDKAVFKDRREFSGSLLKQLEDIYEYLNNHNHIHAEIKGLIRQEEYDYPIEAIRESLLNSLVHRDYTFSSSTLISVFDDRIEFVSIGGLPKGVSLDDIQLGLSVLRNENLASVFYRLHLIEAFGMGIPNIMRSYSDCARKPELQTSGNAFKIMLPNKNVQPKQAKGDSFPMSENEQKIIKLLNKRGDIGREDVEAALKISQAMAIRLLRSLVDKGLIQVIGKGKNTRYIKAS